MKTKLILISLIVFFLASCKETPPYINLIPANVVLDTNYLVTPVPSPEPVNALIEDFTGVRCPNCPSAQAEGKKIADANPGRVNMVSIHPLGLLNALTTPFSVDIGDEHTSRNDFRTDPGAQIFSLVGVTQNLPVGAVNRKLYAGELNRALDYPKWASYVNSELTGSTPVNIGVQAWVTPNDSVAIYVTLTYTQAQPDSNYLTVSILESNMIDYQERTLPTGSTIIDTGYVHNHVLRAVVSDYYGDLIKAKLEPGRVIKKLYLFKRKPIFNKSNLQALVIVHKNTKVKDVMHSKEVDVQ